MDRHPYRTPGEVDDDGWVTFYLEVIELPPPRLGVLVGEFAHNSRSALDHLAWELVYLHGGKPGTHTGFPIFVNNKDWESKVKHPSKSRKSLLHDLPAELIALVYELQPCHGRKESAAKKTLLGLLHWLNISDKHKTLHVAESFRAGGPPIVRMAPAPRMIHHELFVHAGNMLKDGMKLVRAKPELWPWSQAVSQANVDLTLGVSFGERTVGFITLQQILELVAETMVSFDRAFFNVVPDHIPVWDR